MASSVLRFCDGGPLFRAIAAANKGWGLTRAPFSTKLTVSPPATMMC